MHPRADEGEMTRLRASLVSGVALAERAREEAFPERLHLGGGEMKSGGHRRDSILADAYEAVIAAIYLDGGWTACREAVRSRFGTAVGTAPGRTEKDPKTRLQELLQGEGLPVPVYDLTDSRGEDHARTFEVTCTIEALSIHTRAEGSSRRTAEQRAAAEALEHVIAKLAE
ncbi:Ribonuclease III [Dokdonella koreensis DS-123]|uniref:Ribonuclease III n=1 Tax=Dokdonella koreensis DS-123 TaxID=1300342 RepID=A0A167GGL1_9GAMM|nr:Ribonuclease III [Dokdonella koreensis DS-123]